MMIRLLLVPIVVALVAVPAITQKTGSLRVQIVDRHGAAIPAAKVELKGTGFLEQKHTNTEGNYSFDKVPFGHYDLRVIAAGFPRAFNYEIDFSGGKEANHDFALAPCSDEPSKPRSESFGDAARAAIIRELLWQVMPESAAASDQKPIVESQGFDRAWLTTDQNSRLRIMSRKEIQVLAEKTIDQQYWMISSMKRRGGCVEVSLLNDIMLKDHANMMTWGPGVEVYEFRKVNGQWTGLLFVTEIS